MSESRENVSTNSAVWKRAGLIAVAGTLFGFGAALWLGGVHRQPQAAPHWVRVESGAFLPSASAKDRVEPLPLKRVTDSASETGNVAPAEVERLKTRNRRLEALVEVLKKRAQEKAQFSRDGSKVK